MNWETFKTKAVGHARWLARQYEAEGVVVLVLDRGTVSGASYGDTKAKCRELGTFLDKLIDSIEATKHPETGEPWLAQWKP
jgi:hypothetical protein